jgi:hypothetical protein
VAQEPEGSSPHTQQPATGPCPEPVESNPHPPKPISLRSILIPPCHLRFGLASGLFPSGFPTKILYTFLSSPMRARSRVRSGSIVSAYGLDDRAIGVRSPAGAKDFSSILCVQTGSGTHPASCTLGTGGPFPGGKARKGRDADHSSPSSVEELHLLSP